MPKPLVHFGIEYPGFYGLNKEQKDDNIPHQWATEAQNAVFDLNGRLSARKGYQYINAAGISGVPNVKAIHEYIDATGASITILAAGNKIYKVSGDTLVDITGSITTPTADNWKFQNFNGWCIGFQENHAPITLTTVGGSFVNSSTIGPSTQYNGTDVLATFGRAFTLLNNVLYYSDLLINNFAGGSSGSFDLAAYWQGGMDTAVALAEFNGYLVVFGKNNIIVYQGMDDPANASIVENISGVGCIARDSVQLVGNDILFLSHRGVLSLSRVIQEKSMPMRDVSKNIKTYMLGFLDYSQLSDIKSAYDQKEGFYLLSIPNKTKAFCFDVRSTLEDGSYRATEWNTAFHSCYALQDQTLLLGNAGYISTYTGYYDAVTSAATVGTVYQFNYESPWHDFGQEVADYLKLAKRCSVHLYGAAGQNLLLKWAFDYSSTFNSKTLLTSGGGLFEWGVAEWGLGEWNGSAYNKDIETTLTKNGRIIKIGVSTDVAGTIISLQRIDVQAKIGKLKV